MFYLFFLDVFFSIHLSDLFLSFLFPLVSELTSSNSNESIIVRRNSMFFVDYAPEHLHTSVASTQSPNI